MTNFFKPVVVLIPHECPIVPKSAIKSKRSAKCDMNSWLHIQILQNITNIYNNEIICSYSASSMTTVRRILGPPWLFTETILPIATTVPITSIQ